ncbi:MAG: MotA/TolQ/ExbB proton channel family protein [Kiritimatiellaeota bacterium]|nr:MotA/TolQ/ExbB proton channel family protein [Kiritimatiellota bacterium]
MDLFLSGGVLSWVLLAFGVVAGLLFLERLLRLRGAGVNVGDLLNGVKTLLARGGVEEALSQCEEAGGPAAAVMRAAVAHRDAPTVALREALESTGHAEVARMERRLAPLLTLGQAAPLLGLLGALWGLYETLAAANSGVQTHLVQAADLTQGAARAISNAACGLVVALLCHVFYNTIIVRIDRLILDMERVASEMTMHFAGKKEDHREAQG